MNCQEDDDYEALDESTQTLLNQTKEILKSNEITEEEYKKFIKLVGTDYEKIFRLLHKSENDKIINYLSKVNLKQASTNYHFQAPAKVNHKTEFFNPSAPVWVEEGDKNDSTIHSINNLLLKYQEEEDQKKSGPNGSLKTGKNFKVRLESWQYAFADFSKYHEKASTVFPLYGAVARVMYASGDMLEVQEEAVEMMHSQLEELIKGIFAKKLLAKLVKQSLQSKGQDIYEVNEDEEKSDKQFIFPKQNKMIRKGISGYIQKIFSEQYQVYKQFRQTYLNIKEEGTFFGEEKKSIDKDHLISQQADEQANFNEEEDIEEDEDQQLKEMKDHFDEDDQKPEGSKRERVFFEDEGDDDDEESDQEEAEKPNAEDSAAVIDTLNQIEQIQGLEDQIEEKHIVINHGASNQVNTSIQKTQEQLEDDRLQFNKQRTDAMKNEEWNYFMQTRSMTFSSKSNRKVFLSLLNINSLGNNFLEAMSPFIPFLSYSLCKIVARVIEQVLRTRNNEGKFLPSEKPATSQEIQINGNSVINNYIQRAKRHVFAREKLVKAAFSQFVAEYKNNGYDQILVEKPAKGTLNKGGEEIYMTLNGQKFKSPLKSEKDNDVGKQDSHTNSDKKSWSNSKEKGRDGEMLKDAWKSMKISYLKMWVERVISEKQVKRIIEEIQLKHGSNYKAAITELLRLDSTQIVFINKYANYLYERALEDLQRGANKPDYSSHFKTWFLNSDSQRTGAIQRANVIPQNQVTDHRKKLIKFESILD